MDAQTLEFTITSWQAYREAEPALKKGGLGFAPGAFVDCEAKLGDRMVRISGYKHDYDTAENIPLVIDVDRSYLSDVLEACQANARFRIEGKIGIYTSYEVSSGHDRYTTMVNGGKPKKWVCDPEMAFKIQKTQYRARTPYALIECYIGGFDKVLDNAFTTMGWLER